MNQQILAAQDNLIIAMDNSTRLIDTESWYAPVDVDATSPNADTLSHSPVYSVS